MNNVKNIDHPNMVFERFDEFRYFSKWLNQKQRDVLLQSLTDKERYNLNQSYRSGGWEDLLMRDALDTILNGIKRDLGCDLLEIRCKVLNGKSVFIPTAMWKFIVDTFGSYHIRHTQYILGGMKADICKSNTKVSLLLPIYSKE